MADFSDDKLDRLLREAYPSVELSPDFTLRLWRKLMGEPFPTFWRRIPAAALATAAAVGVVAGVWSWGRVAALDPERAFVLARVERLDLFGNAPYDTLAGVVLRRMGGESA